MLLTGAGGVPAVLGVAVVAVCTVALDRLGGVGVTVGRAGITRRVAQKPLEEAWSTF